MANVKGEPSSIWPVWNRDQLCLKFQMPFDERFWRKAEVRDPSFSWNAEQRVPESAPVGVKGFIVALPVTWTAGEDNISGMNLTLLAEHNQEPATLDQSEPSGNGLRYAKGNSLDQANEGESTSAV